MKKILFHINSLEQGGAERVVSNLANRFSIDNYEVLVATEWGAEHEFPLQERVQRIHVGLTEKEENASRIIKACKRVINLRKAVKRERPDIVISFCKANNNRSILAVMGTKIPLITSVRTNPIGCYDNIKDRIFMALFYKRINGCVFQTIQAKEFFNYHLQKNSKIILNPLNPKYMGINLPSERNHHIVNIARLEALKNQEMIIEAFEKIHELHPEFELFIYGGDAGDGTKKKLERIIHQKKLENFVHLEGSCSEIEKRVPGSALYVHASNYEGMPNAVIEAMAMQLPVVATDCPCGGPAYLIKPGKNGLLVPVKNKEKLVEAMLYMLENKDEAEEMAKAAGMIVAEAAEENIYQQWKDYVEELIIK